MAAGGAARRYPSVRFKCSRSRARSGSRGGNLRAVHAAEPNCRALRLGPPVLVIALRLTGAGAGSSPAKRGRWREAPEGADAHTHRSSETDGLQLGMAAQRGTPPPPCFAWSPSPINGGGSPVSAVQVVLRRRGKRVRHPPQPHSPPLVPTVGTAPWSLRAWQRPQVRLGPCKPSSFAGVPPFYPATSRSYSATPCTWYPVRLNTWRMRPAL